jgi:hypothetical protein
MTATTQKVRLKFRCDQDFDNMPIGSDGKPFCEMCQKSLVDFRTKSLTEVASYTQEKSGCGVFKAEHVESDEIMIFSFASVRKYFFAIGTFLIAETSYSQIAEDSLNPISEKANNTHDSLQPSGIKIVYSGFVKTSDEKNNIKAAKAMKRRDFKYGVFLSRRFPFIRFRKMIINQIWGFW